MERFRWEKYVTAYSIYLIGRFVDFNNPNQILILFVFIIYCMRTRLCLFVYFWAKSDQPTRVIMKVLWTRPWKCKHGSRNRESCQTKPFSNNVDGRASVTGQLSDVFISKWVLRSRRTHACADHTLETPSLAASALPATYSKYTATGLNYANVCNWKINTKKNWTERQPQLIHQLH